MNTNEQVQRTREERFPFWMEKARRIRADRLSLAAIASRLGTSQATIAAIPDLDRAKPNV